MRRVGTWLFGALLVAGCVARGSNESPGPDASAHLRYIVNPASRDPAVLSAWLHASLVVDLERQADPSRTYVVIVDHPDVEGASASIEVLVVAPLRDGSWRIWRAH